MLCIHALHAAAHRLRNYRVLEALCRQNAVRKEAAFAVHLNHFHGFLGANVGKDYCYTNDTIFANDTLYTNLLAIIRVHILSSPFKTDVNDRQSNNFYMYVTCFDRYRHRRYIRKGTVFSLTNVTNNTRTISFLSSKLYTYII